MDWIWQEFHTQGQELHPGHARMTKRTQLFQRQESDRARNLEYRPTHLLSFRDLQKEQRNPKYPRELSRREPRLQHGYF